jgi:hypothetical protein
VLRQPWRPARRAVSMSAGLWVVMLRFPLNCINQESVNPALHQQFGRQCPVPTNYLMESS